MLLDLKGRNSEEKRQNKRGRAGHSIPLYFYSKLYAKYVVEVHIASLAHFGSLKNGHFNTQCLNFFSTLTHIY